MHSEDRRGEGTLARVGVPQQPWVDPVLFEAGAATRSLLTPREVRKRASTHTQVRTDGGAGGRADRVRRTWRVLPTGRMRAGRPAGPLKCNRRASVTVWAHGSGVAVAMVCHLVRRSSSRTIEFGFVG